MPTRTEILEARALFERAIRGNRRASLDLEEALSTSDFPIMLNAAYGREMQQEYEGTPSVWSQFATRKVVPDFRKRTLVNIMGGRAELEKVKEGEEYPARSMGESERSFSVEKFGARFPLTWEMRKNDDLGAFQDLPTRLAVSARETEDRTALLPLFNANRTGLSTWANAQAVSSKPLTKDNLNAGLAAIAGRKDSDGRPIILPQPILLIPTALEQVAQAIISVTETVDPDTGEKRSGNGLTRTPKIVVDPWLDIVGTGYAKNAVTWYLTPPPNTASNPALVMGFMTGEESPDLRVKSDAGNRPGGGAISPEEGSFDDDTIQFRVRHVMGSAGLYNDAMYIGVG